MGTAVEAKMGLADEVREYVLVAIIKSARRGGQTTVTFTANQVHKAMGIQGNRMPDVCTALDTKKFLTYAKVQLINRTGPKQSTTAKWTFAV
jgi:hypothetical protein